MKIPKNHPRYISLKTREKIVKGVNADITSIHGLLSHGRGEAFDYLLGEKTNDFAKEAIFAAGALLLLANKPVVSVNGNTAALVSRKLIQLSKLIQCPLEVNIFHSSKKREKAIYNYLVKLGARTVLLPQNLTKIKYLDSNRKYVNKEGIYKADVVFVPLEDGDRAEALIKNGKKIITVDLNPLSRTTQNATIAIVDNITRVMPILIDKIKELKDYNDKELEKIVYRFDNKKNLKRALDTIRKK